MANQFLSMVATLANVVFWGIGYFFGFSIVSVLSFGILIPEEFTNIGRLRHRNALIVFFRRDGKWYVVAELVATLGWLAVCILTWVLISLVS